MADMTAGAPQTGPIVSPAVAVAEFAAIAHVMRPGSVRMTGFADTDLPGALVCARDPRYIAQAVANPAVAGIVTAPDLAADVPARLDAAGRGDIAVLTAEDAQQAFYLVHNALIADHGLCAPLTPGIHPDAVIHPAAHVDPHVQISAGAQVDAGAVIGRGAVIGAGAYVGPGALVAVDGHFSKRFDGKLLRIRHAGGVRIGARSQILAGAIVQRALHPDFTTIGADCVIAPGAHVGHGVQIGQGCTLTGGVQVAGYTTIGREVWIGPGAVIRNTTRIGDHARIEIGAVVAGAVPARDHLAGFFALPRTRALRLMAGWMR
jgi:UDP-3-O-[3-hydroxymyristoyl] glucosamine N-acyltransferase